MLSGYLERDISQDSLQDIKQKVQDKYRWVKEAPSTFSTTWSNHFSAVLLCLSNSHLCVVVCLLSAYRYCESRRRVLLQHVHEGYEKDLWEYIED